ncbi:MAG: DUF1295 domain-containing protein [Saprospiraceae bacterium]|nr:DUF1295 domain-containing protein [Saprospiraceae bacterium]
MNEAILAVVLLNALGFLSAWLLQTDKLTDLLYSTSFVVMIIVLWVGGDGTGGITSWLYLMVLIWAIRLGGYLFWRIHAMGRDARFDDMRPSFWRFMGFWVLQTVSILMIGLPLLLTAGETAEPQLTIYLGAGIWLTGFLVETIADWQKFSFKRRHPDQFMSSGLWRRIRHPNYLGEILVWTGVFLASIPLLEGVTWLALLSPVWIFILLRYISGIPLLEERAEEKYGDQPEYQAYRQNSGRLLPKW